MFTGCVNVYEYFGIEAPEGAVGRLSFWVQQTPAKVSVHRRRPGILILPGGGYDHTSARESEPVALQLTARGYAAFVLEYSVAPLRYPVALREAALAMRFIRERAEEFEIDPHMVAAMGFSAGGHLCGTLGTCYDSPVLADLAAPEIIRPDALGLCYPVAVSWGRTHEGSFRSLCGGDEALRQRLSLEKLVRPDMPPVYLWHTRDDESVPCRNSLILAGALEENGVDFTFHLYRHGCHGLVTGDHMAFPAWGVPEMSREIAGWIGRMADFFEETGFSVKDKEHGR